MTAALSSHLKDGKQQLDFMPHVEQLSPRVVRILGHNPGSFSLQGTNTYLVGTGKRRILIDTGDGTEAYLPELEGAMRDVDCTSLESLVITHWHYDHLGGVPALVKRFGPEIPVRKFMPTEELVIVGKDGEASRDPYAIWPKDRFVPLHDGESISTEGATLRILHTPGHAEDHVVLLLDEENSMFSGDNVLGVGSAALVDLNLYMSSLKTMLAVNPKRIYPGHGPVIMEGVAKLNEYILHRETRILQVHEALKAAAGAVTAKTLATEIYPDLPDDLMKAATHNVALALRKLVADNVATCTQPEGLLKPHEAMFSLAKL